MTGWNIRASLLGVLEVFMFMPEGVKRFDDTRESALRSFIFPMLTYPFLMLTYALSKDSMNTYVLAGHALIYWCGMFAFLGMVFLALKDSDRRDRIWRFITVNNWFSLVGFFLLLPIFISVIGHGNDIDKMQIYIVFLILWNAAYGAFIATKVFSIPWELGGFIAIMHMMIGDVGFRLTESVRDFILT